MKISNRPNDFAACFFSVSRRGKSNQDTQLIPESGAMIRGKIDAFTTISSPRNTQKFAAQPCRIEVGQNRTDWVRTAPDVRGGTSALLLQDASGDLQTQCAPFRIDEHEIDRQISVVATIGRTFDTLLVGLDGATSVFASHS